MKFTGELKLIGDYPCLHTKRRQHGYPARSMATNHRDFPYLNKFFNLCLSRQRCQKCLLTPTNITTGNQRWRPQTSMGWQVFHELRINPQAHGYRCRFHPRVFQGIVFTGERECTIYGFRLIQGHTRLGGKDKREDFLDLESMRRRRDHVAVILRATGFDRLIQADSSNNMCSIQYPNMEDY